MFSKTKKVLVGIALGLGAGLAAALAFVLKKESPVADTSETTQAFDDHHEDLTEAKEDAIAEADKAAADQEEIEKEEYEEGSGSNTSSSINDRY